MNSMDAELVVSDTIALFLAEIFENAKPGHHMIGTVQEGYVTSMRFSVRESDGFVFHEPSDITPLELQAVIARAVLDAGYSTISLKSKLFNGITEVRGWLVDIDGVKTVSPEDLIDAMTTDYDTMTFRTPDPNTRYCDTWK